MNYKALWHFAEIDLFHIYENANIIYSGKRSFAIFDNISHMSSFKIIDSFTNSIETIRLLASLTTLFSNHIIRSYIIFHIYSYINQLFLLHQKYLLHQNNFVHVAFIKMQHFDSVMNKYKNKLPFKLKNIISTQFKLFQKNYHAFTSI